MKEDATLLRWAIRWSRSIKSLNLKRTHIRQTLRLCLSKETWIYVVRDNIDKGIRSWLMTKIDHILHILKHIKYALGTQKSSVCNNRCLCKSHLFFGVTAERKNDQSEYFRNFSLGGKWCLSIWKIHSLSGKGQNNNHQKLSKVS